MTDPTDQPVGIVRLLGRYKAPKDFYDEVHRHAQRRIPDLRYRKEYKAADLVAPALWGEDAGLHQLIGRCIAHQVVMGKLPLRFAGCPRCTNKRYLRI